MTNAAKNLRNFWVYYFLEITLITLCFDSNVRSLLLTSTQFSLVFHLSISLFYFEPKLQFSNWTGFTSSTGNKIWTIHRDNQHHQPSASLKRLIAKVRQRIEGVFHEIQNTGRNPERLLNKTVRGLAAIWVARPLTVYVFFFAIALQ